MKYLARLYLLLVMTLIGAGVSGQSNTLLHKKVHFEQLPAELGLSQRSINCMLQDTEGYLWIGTWSGLLRYDGYTTTLYNADNDDPNKLKSNKIISLYEASDSTIWVGTMIGGLFQYNKSTGQFKQFYHDEKVEGSLSNNNVWSVIEDHDANLWVATENGLNRYDAINKSFEVFKYNEFNPNSLSYNFITDLHVDELGQLWVATENGLNQVLNTNQDEISFKRYFDENTDAKRELSNYIYEIESVAIEGKQYLLWATKWGVKLFDGKEIQNYVVDKQSASFSFFRTVKVIKGPTPFVLLGSELGLSVFDLNTRSFKDFFGNYDKDVNLSENTITEIFIDRSGVLWAGTKKGINKYDTYSNNFELYLTKDFDETKSIITGLVQDKSDRKWLSTLGGGLFEIKHNLGTELEAIKYEVVSGELVDFSNFIQKMSVDINGDVWLGTAGSGIFRFNSRASGNTRKQITNFIQYKEEAAGLTDNYVMSLEPSAQGGMWVGTWSRGLNRVFDDGRIVTYDQSWLKAAPIVTILEDRMGNLWVGTRGNGVYRIVVRDDELVDFKHFLYSEESSSLSNNFINTIVEDSQGQLWVGTEDGVNRYDYRNMTFIAIKRRNGLPSNEVVSILEDDLKRFWVTHNQGVAVINPYELNDLVVNDFGVRDRMQGGFFYNEVILKDHTGRLYFGGSNGLNVINTKEILSNRTLPKTVIQKLTVNNQVVLPNKSYRGNVILESNIGNVKEIRLTHLQNSFSFEFSAHHYAIPEKNQYAYKLEGYDQDWKYTSSDRRFANYTNMKGGDYVFMVKSSNDDGVWEVESKSISIEILPPWWKTKIWIVFYFVIALLFLIVFRWVVLTRLKYENRLEIARFEKRNTHILNKSKLQFFTNISHEFRTPLTLILGPLEQIMNDELVNINLKKRLSSVTQNASRLQRLINQLLDFRKAEAGNLALKVAEGNLYKFLKEIKLSFKLLAADRNIDLDLKSSSNVVNVFFDRDQFEKILYNLLSNAFRHVKDGGKIHIILLENQDNVVVRVKDDGSGILEEHLDKVFDRFYSGETTGASSGIGLALCKSLVELHHGKINVTSKVSQYTQFEFSIPKGKDHFEENEIIGDFKDSENLVHYDVSMDVDQIDHSCSDNDNYVEDISILKKVLIVEDNAQLREFLKSIFIYDYIVLEAENGSVALNVTQEENPDLIISDVMMPIMDGFTFCSKIKQDINTSHIPIILLTARTSYIYNVEGLEKGADDYVTKPFNIEVLKLKVKNLLSSREQFRQIIQSNAELVIEPKKVTVTSADELFIEKTLVAIEEQMSNSAYSVVEFGREMGFSRMQLYRKLKNLTGLSPNEYIRMLKLKRAAQLLEDSDLNITEITYKVGFSDPSYFRKCFKLQFGLSPSGFAKSIKK